MKSISILVLVVFSLMCVGCASTSQQREPNQVSTDFGKDVNVDAEADALEVRYIKSMLLVRTDISDYDVKNQNIMYKGVRNHFRAEELKKYRDAIRKHTGKKDFELQVVKEVSPSRNYISWYKMHLERIMILELSNGYICEEIVITKGDGNYLYNLNCASEKFEGTGTFPARTLKNYR
jgi:hypothetical protein